MMADITYEQSTGRMRRGADLLGVCYSGRGEGLNNPQMENVPDVGPIPRGWYTVGSFFDDPGGKGPLVAHLEPDAANAMFGRSGFMLHGDNEALDHTASEGCIVACLEIRRAVADGAGRGADRLEVVA